VRITELQRVLHVTAAAPGSDKVALTKLALHLMEAVGLEQVTALRKSLQAAEPLGLLPDDELQQAYAMVRDATSRIYARTRLQCLRASNERDLRGLPLNAMQAELAQGAECSLVIDGHNVLHKLPALFRGEFQQGLPGPRARRSLEARLIALGQRHPSLSIQLWFDGPDSNHRTAIENVRVQYSGGTGANRADQEIVAYLRHVQESTPRRARAVVTADLDEALQAEATGAMVMTPQELAVWME
jgi:predicted RNA-binding protein with PIN domain